MGRLSKDLEPAAVLFDLPGLHERSRTRRTADWRLTVKMTQMSPSFGGIVTRATHARRIRVRVARERENEEDEQVEQIREPNVIPTLDARRLAAVSDFDLRGLISSARYKLDRTRRCCERRSDSQPERG